MPLLCKCHRCKTVLAEGTRFFVGTFHEMDQLELTFKMGSLIKQALYCTKCLMEVIGEEPSVIDKESTDDAPDDGSS